MSADAHTAFLWGSAASIAVDVVALNRAVSYAGGRIPERYRSWAYWFCRALLALAAGAFAVAYGCGDPWSAVEIGAATPLLVKRMGRRAD